MKSQRLLTLEQAIPSLGCLIVAVWAKLMTGGLLDIVIMIRGLALVMTSISLASDIPRL
ncbi:hypothetical protein BO82DRAFT_357236 [Aspergillus uvarum CBS 121591]|uniref:Uncharacterized protein n=1 Tax=Aspergillus uvarum CBS 121591 TaxID=1448315 RepID=A0A319CSH4_9EURO|nr:hypothetical protein BO82DRAFT_357236 [Aspergillus uvarum CBS 121591]PYH78518.1 hypothetical protein BO82DRAFT_357236 [Aspergillus uvarum CBS 121591]